jgi:integrase
MTHKEAQHESRQICSFVPNNGYYYANFNSCEGTSPKERRLRYPTKVKAVSDRSQLSLKDEKRLRNIEQAINKYVDTCSLHGMPVKRLQLETYLDGVFRPDKIVKEVKRDLISDHKKMIEGMRAGEILQKSGKRYSPNSIDQYERIRQRWEEVVGAAKDNPATRFILSYDMTIVDCKKMLIFLTKADYCKNTIYDTFNLLKIFLKWSHKEGFHDNEMYKTMSDHIKVSREEADSIAPRFEEIKALYEKKFDNPNHERARDFFVLGCFLALRVNDLRRINNYHLVHDPGGDYFDIFTKKGQKKVKIPCHYIAREIYTKYRVDNKIFITEGKKLGRGVGQWVKKYKEGQLPVFSRNCLNRYIPLICENIILGNKLITYTKGGVTREEYCKRLDLLAPHSMRRFFATYMVVEKGYAPDEVIQWTGHKDREQLLRYIKVDPEFLLKKISLDPDFAAPSASSLNPSVAE